MKDILDIALWIVRNRTAHSFANFTFREIINKLLDAKDTTLLILDKEELVGIVMWIVNTDNSIFVTEILTTRKNVVKLMMQICLQKYPNYTIRGIHSKTGRSRHFKDAVKLTNRLS